MKIKIIIILLLASIHVSYSQLRPQIIDKVIAKVGSEYVLLSDVEKQFAYAKAQQPELDGAYKCTVIENIIASKIMVVQAKLDSIEISDSEVEAQLDFRIDNILGQMGNDEEFFEEYYGQTVTEVKEWMRDDLRNQILSERMQAEIINKVNIRPEEVVDFFESIPKDSLPLLNAEVELAEIIIVPEASDSVKDAAYEKLLNIRSQIVNDSADFAELARVYSDDNGSGAQGGELGWNKRGGFVPEFEAAAFNLEKGELSEIVETQFGYHLIQMNERRGNLINTRHILITPEVSDQDRELAKNFLDSIRTLVLADSLTFSAAVKKYSDKDAESYNNNGRMTNPETGSTFYSTTDTPTEIYFNFLEKDNPKVGDISEPLEFTNRKGDVLFRIVQLQSKTNPHVANLEQDYSKLRNFAIESKKNEYFNEWIESKLRTTYMEVDPMFQQCPNISSWIESKEN